MDKRISFLLFLLIIQIVQAEEYNIKMFSRSYFKIISLSKGFYPVKAGLENAIDEIPLHYGYVNADLYTDLVTITKDRTKLKFYRYSDETGLFESILEYASPQTGESILNLKLVEIKEGLGSVNPDLVIISETKGSKVKNIMRGFHLVSSDNKLFLKEIPKYLIENTSDTTQEPLNIQLFEDSKVIDFWLLTNEGKRILYYWDEESQTIKNKSFVEIIDGSCTECLPSSSIEDKTIPPYSFSSYVDINHDCKSDLIIESTDSKNNKYLEFYINNSQKFALIKLAKIPASWISGSLEDINQDNNPDLIFFDTKEKKMNIIWNEFPKNNGNSLCLESNDLGFHFPGIDKESLLFKEELLKSGDLYSDIENKVIPRLRFGDFDQDGYPEVLVNWKTTETTFYVFQNLACSDEKLKSLGVDAFHCRTFSMDKYEPELSKIRGKNSIQASLFDFGERGLFKKKTGIFQS